MTMKHATIGTLDVGRIGLGTMGMSHAYTGAGTDEAESIRTIHPLSPEQIRMLDDLTPAAGGHQTMSRCGCSSADPRSARRTATTTTGQGPVVASER
jgi:hypothetical protein